MMSREKVPQVYRGMYDRALGGKSRKAGVRCHCLMCVGFQETEVRECSALGCPLYPYRMGSPDPAPPGGTL